MFTETSPGTSFIDEHNLFTGAKVNFRTLEQGPWTYSSLPPGELGILSNLVNTMCNPLIKLKNVPSSIEVNLRKKGNSFFLYLINFTSEMRRPVQRIIPVSGLEIEDYEVIRISI